MPKITSFLLKNRPALGLCPQTPYVSGGWGLRRLGAYKLSATSPAPLIIALPRYGSLAARLIITAACT